jgi:sugar/nucleoside kinase (ribokinase family)
MIHPRAYAVAASAEGVVTASGPFIEKPLISTGAGDHFNAVFCLGKLIGADNEMSLEIGVGASGYYVRTATSPNAMELADFLHSL